MSDEAPTESPAESSDATPDESSEPTAEDSYDAIPVQSDTPEDHSVIGMTVDAALLPEWYDAICQVAHPLCRRMSVVEKPEEWLMKVELPNEVLLQFKRELVEAWEAFVVQRKSEGRWEE